MPAIFVFSLLLLATCPAAAQSKMPNANSDLNYLRVPAVWHYHRMLTCPEQLANYKRQYHTECTSFGGPPPNCRKGCLIAPSSCNDRCDDCKAIAQLIEQKQQQCGE